ncbi:hypothetical protein [Escherichia phage vB-Eco-KMB25]|nr:hypothetical protein SUPREME284_53 [Citrobacter phage vB_CfrD_Supreme284]WPK28028.1 hypothetical protein [Escherichia phage vB-Eco-KMB25]
MHYAKTNRIAFNKKCYLIKIRIPFRTLSVASVMVISNSKNPSVRNKK